MGQCVKLFRIGVSGLNFIMCRSLWENVSYQLVGAESTGVSQGVLVHFSEDMVTNDTSI